jgi:hypothetical protein
VLLKFRPLRLSKTQYFCSTFFLLLSTFLVHPQAFPSPRAFLPPTSFVRHRVAGCRSFLLGAHFCSSLGIAVLILPMIRHWDYGFHCTILSKIRSSTTFSGCLNSYTGKNCVQSHA